MRIRTRASPPLKAEHSTANADSTRVRSDAFTDGGPFSPRACRVRGASSARHPTPHRIPNARRARSALPESAAKRTWYEGRRSSRFDPERTFEPEGVRAHAFRPAAAASVCLSGSRRILPLALRGMRSSLLTSAASMRWRARTCPMRSAASASLR